jgi:hypothetical protein
VLAQAGASAGKGLIVEPASDLACVLMAAGRRRTTARRAESLSNQRILHSLEEIMNSQFSVTLLT